MKTDLRSIARHLLLLVICLFSVVANAQVWMWAKGEGDIGNDASNSVTTDAAGNTYVTGNIAGRADFSGTIYQGNGLYEIFIAKYDVSGSLQWVKLAGGDRNDQGTCIKWKDGFLYLCGSFEDTAAFESTTLISRGEGDAFVAKYNDSGNLLWVKQAGGTGLDYASSLDIDNSGNIYVAGTYENSMRIGLTTLSTTNIYSESFYAKFDGTGNLSWAKTTRGNNANLITGVAYDKHQGVFLTGYFGNTFRLDSTTVSTGSASYDIFLAKVETSNGALDWLKRAGSTYEDGAHGVCSDNDGNPSITGYFAGTAYFDNNTVTYADYNDVFVAHYDSSGNNLWVRAGRGNKLDVGFAITSDNNGNIFATGMFQNVIDFDGRTLTAPDVLDRNIFVVSYSPSGNIRWIAEAGKEDTDCGLGITVQNNGRVNISGYYLHTCEFGEIAIDYANGTDLFVASFNPPVGAGINEVETIHARIYPNPVSGDCELQITDNTSGMYTVYNAVGHKTEQGTYKNNTQLHSNGWPAGIYMVELVAGDKKQIVKLVKQ
ncbi:MAG TPA: T9SS type A sorting domain-containing protein [Chitinophagales bacterium]|nr:T9SS type A sorting domain-containing protein [Chitinophagales bacterium]